MNLESPSPGLPPSSSLRRTSRAPSPPLGGEGWGEGARFMGSCGDPSEPNRRNKCDVDFRGQDIKVRGEMKRRSMPGGFAAWIAAMSLCACAHATSHTNIQTVFLIL